MRTPQPRAPRPATRRRLLAMALALLAGVSAVAPVARGDGDRPSDALAEYEDQVEQAVDRALAYLAGLQQEDGSFRGPARGNTGVTSLCVMAFLARGHTPGTGPYGEVINRGIDFVLDSRVGSGLLVGERLSQGPMYSHGISTLLLSEVSGMVDPTRQERIDDALPEALRVILAAQQINKEQRARGGWRYQPDSRDSDISCSGWMLMALRSARANGAAIPKEAIDQGLEYVLRCRHASGGFGYTPGGGPGWERTGTGLLSLELLGRRGRQESTDAADWILENLPRSYGQGSFFGYGIYYTSQGMFQLGGEHWERWGRHLYEMVLPRQRDNGSWPALSGNEGRAGDSYATAMVVLSLTVTHRQLPIYQR